MVSLPVGVEQGRRAREWREIRARDRVVLVGHRSGIRPKPGRDYLADMTRGPAGVTERSGCKENPQTSALFVFTKHMSITSSRQICSGTMLNSKAL